MTGYGDARATREPIELRLELRAVNNRYFKFNCRLPENYAGLESRIEKKIRQSITRGTVSLSLSRSHTGDRLDFTFDRDVIDAYLSQWDLLREQLHQLPVLVAGDLLQLPGVIHEPDDLNHAPEEDWDLIAETIDAAMARFSAFREEEGRLMADDLRTQAKIIEDQLVKIAARSAHVVTQYRDRMLERVTELLREHDLQIQSSDVIREVSQFADRCDINEEIVRLRAHLGQFETFLNSSHSEGKRLDFLSQEINREVNTIGSKANDVEIAHCVVEMKAAVEKIREVLQNVE